MIRFVPFEPDHFKAIQIQGAQAYLSPMQFNEEYCRYLEGELAWTGVNGSVLGCSGVLPLWEGRAMSWAVYDRRVESPSDWGRIFAKTKTILERAHELGHRRIETTVDAEFPAAHRYAQALGFKDETPEGMEAYSPDGRTFHLYARVR